MQSNATGVHLNVSFKELVCCMLTVMLFGGGKESVLEIYNIDSQTI